jgi:hypothetical protein
MSRLALALLFVCLGTAQGRIAYDRAPTKGFALTRRDTQGSPLSTSTTSVRFVPGTGHLVSTTQSELILWDLATKAPLWAIEIAKIKTAEISSDGKFVFVAAGEPNLFIEARRLSDGSLHGKIPIEGPGVHTVLGSSRAGNWFAYSTMDFGGAVDWIHFEPGDFLQVAEQRRIALGGKYVDSIAFTPSGDRLAVTGDGELIVLDTATGNPISSFKAPEGLGQVALSPDGSLVATSGSPRDPRIQLWEAQSATALAELSLKSPLGAGRLSFTPDGAYLFAASALGKGREAVYAQVYDVATRAPVAAVFRPLGLPPRPNLYLGVRDLHFSADGKSLAIALYSSMAQPFTVPHVYVVNFETEGTEK